MSRSRLIAFMCIFFAGAPMAAAQALPTATVGIFPSMFVGATATRTGLDAGRNLAIAGGVDIGFLVGKTFQYTVEYRGIYPVDKGGVNSQKSSLIGFDISRRNGRLHPYGDVFFGRGEIDYAGPGTQVPGTAIFYTQSSSNVIAAGGGVDFDLSPHFALKLDALLQRYNTPVTTSGHIYPQSGTVALVYRIPHRHSVGNSQLNSGRHR